ncbi:class I SAM-dependent methyltransferase [Marinicella litoralis]|uniref:Methyltransferase family protein n=1 Tax=Marinicella litoralis TaxID=644220 RepID=A0A4R6XLP1_9GAMM|nr:class I SAM-dependent methyltransferase [Marinicella litoralis]TDR20486.1 methyltransferase family protein [Marinicella litoralis]
MSYFLTNKHSWNQRVETHFNSDFYDVPGFLAGKTALNEIELAALPDVAGLSLLHLQCHFGLDSLSWARLGAEVTGVDISDAAIQKANELKAKTQLKADFIAADVYSFGESNQQQFDLVYTSYGAICWLPDLVRWAQVISRCLKTGGTFYMAEFHPIIDLMAGYEYFHRDDPDISLEDTYTENCDGSQHEFAVWAHPMGDVINALIKAGLVIESVEEFDYSPYNCFAGMQEKQKGRFYLTHKDHHVPMVYAIKAKKSSPTA